MATHTHAVTLRETNETVAVIIIELATRRFCGIEFHLVFAHDHVELLGDELRISVVVVVNIYPVVVERHACANIFASLCGVCAKRSGVEFLLFKVDCGRIFADIFLDIELLCAGHSSSHSETYAHYAQTRCT